MAFFMRHSSFLVPVPDTSLCRGLHLHGTAPSAGNQGSAVTPTSHIAFDALPVAGTFWVLHKAQSSRIGHVILSGQ
jgi:hypothetical protein